MRKNSRKGVMRMKVLVIGSGGREHVLCWKLSQSKQVSEVFCAPGNAGIAEVATCVPIGVGELEKLADFAVANGIDFTVVGPEAPLCDGVVDVFRARNLRVFGPDRRAAQLEGSKDFAKQFMLKYDIPTAKAVCFRNRAAARAYVENEFASGAPGVVVKADGLAAGKGVLVGTDPAETLDFIDSCFEGAFGNAGGKVLIEEMLVGEEASILALTDGKSIRALVSAQDHKRVGDGDRGPNTGGMGAYSPAPVVTDAVMATIQREILDRFLVGVRAEALDFRGLLFVGVMVTAAGPKVLEFNVRFGDPEVQAVLCRFEGDLFEVMNQVVDGELDRAELIWSPEPAVCIVLASGGYPEKYAKGFPIRGLEDARSQGCCVFHAGTERNAAGEIVNAGGRVLGVTARGADIRAAIEKAYRGVDRIAWEGGFCRRDIGYRALQREKK